MRWGGGGGGGVTGTPDIILAFVRLQSLNVLTNISL